MQISLSCPSSLFFYKTLLSILWYTFKNNKDQLINVYQTHYRTEIKCFMTINFNDLEKLRDRLLIRGLVSASVGPSVGLPVLLLGNARVQKCENAHSEFLMWVFPSVKDDACFMFSTVPKSPYPGENRSRKCVIDSQSSIINPIWFELAMNLLLPWLMYVHESHS